MNNRKKTPLSEIGKELPFTVPENYFEHFALNIDAQIGSVSYSNRKFVRSWMYAAAAFVGVFMLGQTFYKVYEAKQVEKAEYYESYVLSQVNEAAMIDYYSEESTE